MKNILWIILDDSGPDMFSFSGGSTRTPNIDRIAREGVHCTEFHTPSPICTPSRYSYLTGRIPGHCPSPSFSGKFPKNEHYKLGFDVQIDPEEKENIAAHFKAGGYRTGMVGKYHAGPGRGKLGCHQYDFGEDPTDPDTARKLKEDYARMQKYFRSIGFDYADGISWDNTDNRPLRALQYHNLEWQTDHALRFLDGQKESEEPFFLYFATTTQHGPHHAESLKADPRITEWGFLEEAPQVQPGRESVLNRCRDVPTTEMHLATGAVWTDDAVGALWEKLESLGLAEETIVIFSTDHGPGTRSGKFTCYQGGAKIPFAIRCPGSLPAGTHCEALLQNVDVLPTLASLCGLPVPDWPQDGADRTAQLKGAQDDREDLYFELGNYRAVRTSRWKYIALRYQAHEVDEMKSGKVDCAYRAVINRAGGDYAMHLYPHYFDADQLYDLEQDPGEQENLFGKEGYEAVTADLQKRLRRHLDRFDYPYPEQPDPFVFTEAFRQLCQKSREDESIYRHDWYQNHGW